MDVYVEGRSLTRQRQQAFGNILQPTHQDFPGGNGTHVLSGRPDLLRKSYEGGPLAGGRGA